MLERFEKAGVPVVALFSRDGGYANLPLVAPTSLDASQQASERLLALGHRRIGLITPSRRVDYMRAFRQKAVEAGLQVRDFAPRKGEAESVNHRLRRHRLTVKSSAPA